jgi:hypothetical protein
LGRFQRLHNSSEREIAATTTSPHTGPWSGHRLWSRLSKQYRLRYAKTRVHTADRIHQDRRTRLDAQRPLTRIDIRPLIQQWKEPSPNLSVTARSVHVSPPVTDSGSGFSKVTITVSRSTRTICCRRRQGSSFLTTHIIGRRGQYGMSTSSPERRGPSNCQALDDAWDALAAAMPGLRRREEVA